MFDRSWYRRVLADRVDRLVKGRQLQQAYEDIRSFERQLADDGTVILKFFLHISKKEQKKRFRKLMKNKATRWRVSAGDLKRHRQYAEYLAATNDMLAETDSEDAPWTIVEAHDRRFATLKVFSTIANALERQLADKPGKGSGEFTPEGTAEKTKTGFSEIFTRSVLDNVDLDRKLTREEYQRKLDDRQERLRELEHEIYGRRVPVVILYEGWDAAGKGGNIRRLVQNLDPRGYEVIPIAAPNDIEKAHHYLWRFWTQLPKAGHIALFDRSWYGRVLVERVEGFCSEAQWKRAYREINEMEQHMVHFGAVIVKFWLHVDKDEQLRRFKQRQKTAAKRWKITAEDWRNREKWDLYKTAIEEMITRTSTPFAPWTVVESNCKWYARVKTLETVIEAIEKRLAEKK